MSYELNSELLEYVNDESFADVTVREDSRYYAIVEVASEDIDRYRCKAEDYFDVYEEDEFTSEFEAEDGYVLLELQQNDRYEKCDDCGEWFCSSEMTHVWWGRNVCADCLDDNYRYCERCDRWVYYDDYDFDRDMCYDCSDDYGDCRVREYHDSPYREFYGDGNVFVGCELEIDNGGDESSFLDAMERLFEPDEIYFERDGSLGEAGIECITQPHTIDAFKTMNWKDILATCVRYGYRSHDAGCCGLHFHLSRELFGENRTEQKESVAKLIYFYDKWFDAIMRFARRRDGHWCKSYELDYKANTTEGRMEYAREYANSCHDRYRAVNVTNYDTIEIRMMRGTLRYETFMASLDFVWTTAVNATKIAEADIDNLAMWLDGLEENTWEYIRGRNIEEFLR